MHRSGTGLHVDPLGTSAWNTLVHGRKRWVLFPPHTDPRSIKTNASTAGGRYGYRSEGIAWFHHVLSSFSESDAIRLGMMDFVQEAGECVFVPGGGHY